MNHDRSAPLLRALAAALLLFAVVACAGGAVPDASSSSGHPSGATASTLSTRGSTVPGSTPSSSSATSPGQQVTTSPETPASGQRLVGMDGVVVAVPQGWGTATEPCDAPNGPTVLFLGFLSLRVDCGTTPRDGVSSLAVASAHTGAITLGRGADLVTEIRGLTILHSGVTCRRDLVRVCDLTFTVQGSDAVFHVSIRGPGARAQVLAMRDSVRRVPSGQVTVPFIEYGTPVAEAKGQLVEAGLRAHVAAVDFPHSVVGTDPPAGDVVAIGTVVEVRLGDG